eukprot:403344023
MKSITTSPQNYPMSDQFRTQNGFGIINNLSFGKQTQQSVTNTETTNSPARSPFKTVNIGQDYNKTQSGLKIINMNRECILQKINLRTAVNSAGNTSPIQNKQSPNKHKQSKYSLNKLDQLRTIQVDSVQISAFPQRLKKPKSTNKFLDTLKMNSARTTQNNSLTNNKSRQLKSSQIFTNLGSKEDKVINNHNSFEDHTNDQKGNQRKQSDTSNFKTFFDTQSKAYPITKFQQNKSVNDDLQRVRRNNEIFKSSQFRMKRLLDIKIDNNQEEKLKLFQTQILRQNQQSQIFQLLVENDIQYPFKDSLINIQKSLKTYMLLNIENLPQFLKDEAFQFKLLSDQHPELQQQIGNTAPYNIIYEKLLHQFFKFMKKQTKKEHQLMTKIKNLQEIVELHTNKQPNDQELENKLNAEQMLKMAIQERCNMLVSENAELHKDKNIFQFKLSESQIEIEELLSSNQRLRKDYKSMNEQRLKLLEQNQDLSKKFQEAEKRRDDMEFMLKEKCKHLETTLILLNNTKIKLETVEIQLKDIQNQNHKLAIRGASSFTELTPRYSKFREIFEEFNIKTGLDQPAGMITQNPSKNSLALQNKANLMQKSSTALQLPGMQENNLDQSSNENPLSNKDDNEFLKLEDQDTVSKMSKQSDRDEDIKLALKSAGNNENKKSFQRENVSPKHSQVLASGQLNARNLQKFTSAQLTDQIVNELRRKEKKIDKLMEKEKKMIKTQKKLQEQITTLNKQIEQYEVLKRRFTSLQPQTTQLNPSEGIKSYITQKLGNNRKPNASHGNAQSLNALGVSHSAANSGESTPMTNTARNRQLGFQHNRGQSQILPVNDFGFGHMMTMQDEVSNQAKEIIENKEKMPKFQNFQDRIKSPQLPINTLTSQRKTTVTYQDNGIIIEEDNQFK